MLILFGYGLPFIQSKIVILEINQQYLIVALITLKKLRDVVYFAEE